MLLGHVAAFDPERGWGQVVTERGDTLEFHATAIASGLRTINIGTAVAFVRVAGHIGTWVADHVTPLD